MNPVNSQPGRPNQVQLNPIKPQRQQGRPNQVIDLNPVKKPSRSQSNKRPSPTPARKQQSRPAQGARAPQQGHRQQRPQKTQLTLNPVRPSSAPQATNNDEEDGDAAYSDNNLIPGQVNKGKKPGHSKKPATQHPSRRPATLQPSRPAAQRPTATGRPSAGVTELPESGSGSLSQGQQRPTKRPQPTIAKPSNKARPRPQKRPGKKQPQRNNPDIVDIVEYDTTLGDDDVNDVPILFADPFSDIREPDGPNRLYEAPQFGFRFF